MSPYEISDDGDNRRLQDLNELGCIFTDLTGEDDGAEGEKLKQQTKKKKKNKTKKMKKNQSENSNNDTLIENEKTRNLQRGSSFFPHEQTSPWLIYFSHGKHGKLHTLYSLESHKFYKKRIPALVQKSCLIYAHGWLLMQDWGTEELVLLNPVSMKRIDLPKPSQVPPNEIYNDNYKSWFLTAPPTNDSCMILISYHTNPFFMFCYVHEKKWHIARYHTGQEGGLQNFVISNNIIYAQTPMNNTLCTVNFDLYQLNVKSLSMPGPFVPFYGIRNICSSLGSFGGDLYCVHLLEIRATGVIVEANVFMMDFATNRWVRMQTIGQKTFFVDIFRGSVMGCIDNVPGIEKDCVYYTGFDDILYRYDLATRGMTMESSFRGLKDPLSLSCWVQSAL